MTKKSNMKKQLTSYLLINNRKYVYILKDASAKTTRILCKAANIDQEFLNEDVPALLRDLPELILSEKKYKERQNELIRFRVSTADKQQIEKIALKQGYTSVSEYLRDLALKNA